MSEKLWLEPGVGFSSEWNGWSRSFEKRASGRYYAKCKNCGIVIDARLPQMRKHGAMCVPYPDEGSSDDIKHIQEVEQTYYDPLHQEDVSEQYREIIVKTDRPHKKKRYIPKVESPVTTKTPVVSKRSRFTDIAKVWERKLEDLPPDQALQIEKNMNDMLYEATMACLQLHSSGQVTVNTSQVDDKAE